MIKLLLLLLPALMPSWAFFKAVEASPRVEWRPLPAGSEGTSNWQPLMRRPEKLSLGALIGRLVWNPHWNESLFINSLSERFTLAPTAENLALLQARIAMRLHKLDMLSTAEAFQFRLVFFYRDGAEIKREVTFSQDAHPILAGTE